MWWFLSLVLIVAFFQAVFLPLNLVFLLILALSLWTQKERWGLVFLAGLILDLVTGSPWGVSSLVFLLVVFLLKTSRQKWYSIIFLVASVFLGGLIPGFILNRSLDFRQAVVMTALAVGLWFLSKPWKGVSENQAGLEI